MTEDAHDHRPQEARNEGASATGRSSSAALVRYSFSCETIAESYAVVAFDAVEELNRPYRVTVWLRAEEEHPDTGEMIGQPAQLLLLRGEQRRSFTGIVSRVDVVEGGATGEASVIEIVPAVATLALHRTTRIFQDKSALEIVETVLGEGLAPYRREFDTGSLRRDSYLVRDYCVQYQETDLDFVHRLLEEEGIGYRFAAAADGDPERMVLFDDNRHLGDVPTLDHGPVRFDPANLVIEGAEPVVRFEPRLQLAPARLTLRDHDWTQGRPTIEQSAGAGPDGSSVYEHGFRHGVTIKEDNELLGTLVSALERSLIPDFMPSPLQGVMRDLFGSAVGDFTRDNVGFQTSIRHQLQLRDRKTAAGTGMVTGFGPGLRFALVNHPSLGADGDYFVTRVRHTSRPATIELDSAEQAHSYANRFECLPLDTPWRPARVTRKPRIYGVQTAVVTGPMGLDLYTDQHGRVKVRFPWDRRGDDPSGAYTCWLRVSQSWAGTGHPGVIFTPRVGMEVIVSFVDGDPDRPLVTGCVYNGRNHPPDLMPARATKSIIRTRTIPHGPGYNELSFEDAMGAEEVFLRAERNLREEVRCNHITHVGNVQVVQVERDQVEQIGRHQRLSVRGDRTEAVHGSQSCHAESYKLSVLGTMNTRVGHSQTVTVESGSRRVTVENGEHALVSSGRFVISQGGENHVVLHTAGEGGHKPGVHVTTSKAVFVQAGDAKMTLNEDGQGGIKIESTTKIELVVGSSTLEVTPEKIRANNKTFPA